MGVLILNKSILSYNTRIISFFHYGALLHVFMFQTSLTYLVLWQDPSVRAVQGSSLHQASLLVAPEQTILCEINDQAAGWHKVGASNDSPVFPLQRGTFHHRMDSCIGPEQLPQNNKNK